MQPKPPYECSRSLATRSKNSYSAFFPTDLDSGATDIYIELQDFCFYRPDTEQKFTPLHEHMPESGKYKHYSTKTLLFGEFLQYGQTKCWVEGIKFDLLAVDGYAQAEETVRQSIYSGRPRHRYLVPSEEARELLSLVS